MIDPRISATEVARRVQLSRTAIQSRLRTWRRIGFHLGYEVWPNPRLFGARICTIDIPVDSPAQVDRMFDDLGLIEGVISARDLLDEDGRTVRAYVIDDGEVGLSRRLRLLRRVAGLKEVPEIQPYWIPTPSDALSAMDWRILSLYRGYPEASLSEAATTLGISTKTLSARRDRLLDDRAMWWLMNTQSSRFPVASFFISVSDPSLVPLVKHSLETLPLGWIPCADDGFGLSPDPPIRVVSGLSFVDSPASIDDVVRDISRCEGVESVRWRIPRGFRSYREWYDRHILARLASSSRGRWEMSTPAEDTLAASVPSSPKLLESGITVEGLSEIDRATDDIPSVPVVRSVEQPRPGFGGHRGRRFAAPGPAV